jgi:hypothetical protein
MESAVAYYRVSTRQQQRSGLGIEAQRATVQRFAEAEGLTLIAEFVEAEIGTPLCGFGGEGTPRHFRADQGRTGDPEGDRKQARQSH